MTDFSVQGVARLTSDVGTAHLPDVGENAFGAIYTSYGSFDTFADVSTALGVTTIRWPGGTLSETRPDVYSLSHENLQVDGNGKPGIRELLAYGVENDMSVSVILPTFAYADDPEAGAADLDAFMGRLLAGDYGEIPAGGLTLEIGNEYYAHYDDPSKYGAVSNAMLEVISDRLGEMPDGAPTIDVAMQVGRDATADSAIRGELSDDAFSAITHLRAHRLSPNLDHSDYAIPALEATRDIWGDKITAAGGEKPEFYLSAWNVSSWTRSEARNEWIARQEEVFGETVSLSNGEMTDRSNAAFEQFWQDGTLTGPDGATIETGSGLLNRDYGGEKEAHVMELFTSYAREGMDMSAIYGVDISHPSDFGTVIGDETMLYSGSGAFRLLSEMVGGMAVLDEPGQNAVVDGPSNNVHSWVYGDDGKIVLFLSSDDIGEDFDYVIDLGTDVSLAWGDVVVRTENPDWQAQKGIPSTDGVDLSPEAEMNELVSIEGFTPEIIDGKLTVRFTEDNQMIRLTLLTDPDKRAELEAFMRAEPAVNDIAGQVSNSPLVLIAGDKVASEMFGGNAGDTITGSLRPDLLSGGDGDDVLNGRAGADVILGGAGRDTLIGAAGNDTIWTGADADEVRYSLGDGHDIIMDFTAGEDLLTIGGFTADSGIANGNDLLAAYGRIDDDGNAFLDFGEDGSISLAGIADMEGLGSSIRIDIPKPTDPAPQDPEEDPEDGGDDEDDDADEDDGTDGGGAGGSCFVATAAYADPRHPDVTWLRQFRDEVLLPHPVGRQLIRIYWVIGPRLARIPAAGGRPQRIVRYLLSRLVSGMKSARQTP